VNETQYQFSQHPKGSYREYMVVKSQDNSCSTLKYTGKRASLESSELVVRGTESGILAIAGDQFHSTVPVDGNLAVTLAITEETDRSDSSRIMSQQIADELIFRNESTSIELDIAAADAAYESILMHQDGWASFVFVRRGRRVLMARTKRNPDYWMPIGGRAKTGDASPLDTAHRELEEEIGVSVERSHFYYLGWQPRDIGVGATHFWSLQLPTQHPYTLNESEFREASWLSLEECQAIDLFPGTIAMLPQLQRHMAGA
jgi:8-oxo-dGTP pyrophosphatase MutT (NUDIX family)